MASSPIDPAVLALASGYPYAFPACSYLFRDGAQHPLPATLPALLADRVPVIACGSNRAPEQLARKFRDWPHPLTIPVLCGRLAGFDVVYSAHFTRYGALPATLHPAPAPGAVVEVAVQWLTGAELERMDATEGIGVNYDRRELGGIRLEIEGLGVIASAEAYLSRRGALAIDGRPVALAAIPCAGRTWPALDQPGVLEAVRARLAPGSDLHGFIHAIVTDPDYRAEQTAALALSGLRLDRQG
ncbi:gamma-glutamylcyclotransferase [Skermanella mucosa]|uniref:gamma-glutamylcyclotransferase family protein n=1 Tax=Skermanella mucosa TaxID=1789672 RepID=UPI00192AC75C|nr:gamma-glutamylcyclotransferase family protein [Skermanella mucosa]UEM21708.1 gamma-glutamylcyclotransferase [Skermanella mucosa]